MSYKHTMDDQLKEIAENHEARDVRHCLGCQCTRKKFYCESCIASMQSSATSRYKNIELISVVRLHTISGILTLVSDYVN